MHTMLYDALPCAVGERLVLTGSPTQLVLIEFCTLTFIGCELRVRAPSASQPMLQYLMFLLFQRRIQLHIRGEMTREEAQGGG